MNTNLNAKYKGLLDGYENMELIHYENMPVDFENTHYFEDLPDKQVSGVLKANRYVDGKLVQTYSKQDNHILTIAATRLGKTSSCVIPMVASFARQKLKRTMIISDPKGELYQRLSLELIQQGYDVLVCNLRDYMHSEYWNPLIDIFLKYQKAHNLEDEVEIVKVGEEFRNRFRGVVYESQALLDEAIGQIKRLLLTDVDC